MVNAAIKLMTAIVMGNYISICGKMDWHCRKEKISHPVDVPLILQKEIAELKAQGKIASMKYEAKQIGLTMKGSPKYSVRFWIEVDEPKVHSTTYSRLNKKYYKKIVVLSNNTRQEHVVLASEVPSETRAAKEAFRAQILREKWMHRSSTVWNLHKEIPAYFCADFTNMTFVHIGAYSEWRPNYPNNLYYGRGDYKEVGKVETKGTIQDFFNIEKIVLSSTEEEGVYMRTEWTGESNDQRRKDSAYQVRQKAVFLKEKCLFKLSPKLGNLPCLTKEVDMSTFIKDI